MRGCCLVGVETMLQQLQYCHSLPVSDRRTRPFGGKRRDRVRVAALRLEDFADIAHNKVLIAAVGSAAIGQLVKPFASTLFYGKDFDFKTALLAGGFPSTHSSTVVAAATSIGLERGFSDSIFGLTVIYAGLVMYDAQGVRREVGIHARTLNNVMPKMLITAISDKELIDSRPAKPSSAVSMKSRVSLSGEESSSFAPEANNRRTSQAIAGPPGTESIPEVTAGVGNSSPLKESIGHTEVEVIAGGLLGFFASLLVYMIM